MRFFLVGLGAVFGIGVNAGWIGGFDLISSRNNSFSPSAIYSMAVSASGEIYVGGDFDAFRVGTSTAAARHIARWDGTNWNTVGKGINGAVRTLLTVGSNVYAGGSFTIAGDKAATNIARWDGTNWWPVGDGLSGQSVNTLLWKDGLLFVGGKFTNSGALELRHIAAWNGTHWSNPGSGVGPTGTAEVSALIDLDGELIAGGFFTIAGDIAATNIARFDGAQWSGLGEGVPFRVFALTTNPDGELFAAGGTSAFGPAAISQWNGETWRSLYTGDFGANRAARVLFWESGHLYTEAAHLYPRTLHDMTGLARLDETGWTNFQGPFYPLLAGPVRFNGRLAFAGIANSPVTAANPYVATWDLEDWEVLGSGAIGSIESFAFDGGDLIAAGRFDTRMSGSRDARLLARWNGQNWTKMNDRFRTAENQVVPIRALAAIPGLVVTTLPFSDVVVSIDGTNLVTLGTEFPDTIQTLGFADTNLYAGGSFGIRTWNGAEWTQVGGGINGAVLAIAGSPQALYVGGNFNEAGGVGARNIAYWNGLNWSGLGEGVDSNVWTISLTPSGVGIFAGGDFTRAGQEAVGGIAEWDGSRWIPLSRGVSLDSGAGRVKAVAVTQEGDVFIGGQFDMAGNTTATNIAVWRRGDWLALEDGIAGTIVNTLLMKDSDLYVGGDFYRSGTAGAYSIARWRDEQRIQHLAIELVNGAIKVNLMSGATQSVIESTVHLGPAVQWNPYSDQQTEVVVTNLTQNAAQFFRAKTPGPF